MAKGGNEMKKVLFGILFLSLAMVVPILTMAAVDIHVGIPLPPPLVFPAPPPVVVLPDTDDVYVAPGLDVDLFFWNGWWWRPWEGRWYRSHYYDRDWGFFEGAPRFYFDVDHDWRRFYRDHDWHGHRWDYDQIPYDHLQHNWHRWYDDRHWERERAWGVHDYQPRPEREREEFRQQREREYHQRPEVQRHEQERRQREGGGANIKGKMLPIISVG